MVKIKLKFNKKTTKINQSFQFLKTFLPFFFQNLKKCFVTQLPDHKGFPGRPQPATGRPPNAAADPGESAADRQPACGSAGAQNRPGSIDVTFFSCRQKNVFRRNEMFV